VAPLSAAASPPEDAPASLGSQMPTMTPFNDPIAQRSSPRHSVAATQSWTSPLGQVLAAQVAAIAVVLAQQMPPSQAAALVHEKVCVRPLLLPPLEEPEDEPEVDPEEDAPIVLLSAPASEVAAAPGEELLHADMSPKPGELAAKTVRAKVPLRMEMRRANMSFEATIRRRP
jgi:hypothetical protein